MTKKGIQLFEEAILIFYKKFGRAHLPWRNKGMTPYRVWVSEIMLQQTQVDRVVVFYRRFLRKFPTVKALSASDWDDFLPYYQGLGYYNRGRNMLKTANIVVSKHKGRFPKNTTDLEMLPGIGEYTAKAILSFAHADDHMAWDTNFNRVFGRYFYGSKEAIIEKQIFERAIKANKRDFNGAIMDFGSLICVKKPKCNACPLKEKCIYNKEGGENELSRRKTVDVFPMKEAKAYVILHKDHKDYYSANRKEYTPFILPKKHTSRDDIKKYFKEKHGLTVSVRPPRDKLCIKGDPVIVVYAQILLGKHTMSVFTKRQVNDTINTIMK